MLQRKGIVFTVLFSIFCGHLVTGISEFPRAIATSLSNKLTNKIIRHIKEENNQIYEGMRMKIYKGKKIEVATVANIPIIESEIIYQEVDHAKPLVIYVHGFREHPSNESIQTVVGGNNYEIVVTAYLERGTDNIFLLDWSDLAFDNYFKVMSRVRDIAQILAETFDKLVDLGLNLETFHLVGHSLGAQIGGFFGRYSKYSIPRITGLDPANPGFYHIGAEHIDADSARFVDIIHTDGGFYGAADDTGTVDFYPNGGSRAQPGCPFLGIPLTPTDLCNHWRSWRYYAETVMYNFAFPATQCPSYSKYKSGRCDNNRKVYYGYAVPKTARGSFYFMTNSKAPYGNNIGYINWNFLEPL